MFWFNFSGGSTPKPSGAMFAQTNTSSSTSTSTSNPGMFTFGAGASKPAETKPASTAPSFAFGAPSQTSSTPAAQQPSSLFTFGAANKPAVSTAPATNATAPSFNFSAGGNKPAGSAPQAPAASSGGMFFTGKPAEAAPTTTTAASNMFAFTGKPGQLSNDKILGSANPTPNLLVFGNKPSQGFLAKQESDGSSVSSNLLGKQPSIFGEPDKGIHAYIMHVCTQKIDTFASG